MSVRYICVISCLILLMKSRAPRLLTFLIDKHPDGLIEFTDFGLLLMEDRGQPSMIEMLVVLTLPDVRIQLNVMLSLSLDCKVVVPLLLLLNHLKLLDPLQH